MSSEQIRDAVLEDTQSQREIKPAVWASTCDGCHEVFVMHRWNHNDGGLGEIRGTFDRCAENEEGRGLGNGFSATVCSFACADKVVKGGWRDMERYKPFADQDIPLVRFEALTLTTLVTYGKRAVLEEADKKGSSGYANGYDSGGFYVVSGHEKPRSVTELAQDLVKNKAILDKIAETALRLRLSDADAKHILWAEDEVASALDVLRRAVKSNSNGGQITLGGHSPGPRDTTPGWSEGWIITKLVNAAGILASIFPEAVGTAKPTREGWRVVRETKKA